ncbi:hydrogen peroxide-dependent heme synthase [Amycolatopsis sp. NPDC001319]|uniref:hydrogen peroxide-dependent heme synthase n=1 Tax=unclassified Amycolatopsis TaxID=2618356 RepID=UPI00369B1EE5
MTGREAQQAYTMWSVFAAGPAASGRDQAAVAQEVEQALAGGATVRGVYLLTGMRADADWMIWWHAASPEALQEAYLALRRTTWGAVSRPVWSSAGLHRDAEFNPGHLPAYLEWKAPARFACVYPFVRSYEWYLLPAAERRRMLADHGAAAHDYPDVLSNTLAAFGLGDYEWILALEADRLDRIVDLMREFRATEARMHVRLDTPFFTGQRVSVHDLVRSLS